MNTQQTFTTDEPDIVVVTCGNQSCLGVMGHEHEEVAPHF